MLNVNYKLVILLMLALFIGFMQIDTNKLMKKIKAAFLSHSAYVYEELYLKYPEDYSNPNIDYVIYKDDEQSSSDINRKFNKTKFVDADVEDYEVKLKLKRILALHNFFNGYLWFTYDVDYFNKDGKRISGEVGSVKLKIHRNGGEWQVVQIKEKV